MSGWVIFAGIVLSLSGLAYLAATDPKRRRTHNLTKIEKRPFIWPARAATFGPGVYLTAIGHWSGLSIWAGAVTTLGWVIAAITPQTYAKLQADLRVQSESVRADAHELFQRLSSMPAKYVPEQLGVWRVKLPRLSKTSPEYPEAAEIVALKARIELLEARLARLETDQGDKNRSIESSNGRNLTSESAVQEKPLDAAE